MIKLVLGEEVTDNLKSQLKHRVRAAEIELEDNQRAERKKKNTRTPGNDIEDTPGNKRNTPGKDLETNQTQERMLHNYNTNVTNHTLPDENDKSFKPENTLKPSDIPEKKGGDAHLN